MDPKRTFINARSTTYQTDARNPRREAESLERRDRARQAVAENGGRSAPLSAAGRATGLTEESDWRKMFGPRTDPSTMAQANQFTPPRTDAAINPYAFGAVTQAQPVALPQGMGGNGTARRMPNGTVEGMIDPRRPDATKFAADNFFTVSGKTSLPPGVIASDGATNVTRGPASSTVSAPMTPSAPNYDARAKLKDMHPGIFEAGTPENLAFVAHAKKFGEDSAHANIDKILPRAANTAAAAPTVVTDPSLISAYQ